jgi:two-component system sensor histidine kinase DesK
VSHLTAASATGHPESLVRHARWFLFVLHVPAMVFPPIDVAFDLSGAHRGPLAVVLAATLSFTAGGLQLRHSFAAARGERPPNWHWSALGLTILTLVPLVWFTWDWTAPLWFVSASALMLLPRRRAIVVVLATLLGLATAEVASFWTPDLSGAATALVYVVYATTVSAIGGIGLYGAARLVCVLDELQATRAQLAELAVGQERLRVSRDLHDLLGHSLSAVSLKGDLALRLLRKDSSAAYAEIVGLAGVARDALRSIRIVTRDEHVISLRTEAEGAAMLFRAAGIDAHIDLRLPELPYAVEEVLAWTVREGVTNVLRHADARVCSIVGQLHESRVELEIVNDGVPAAGDEPTPDGSGLAGLAARASTISGRISAARTAGGWFKLLVEIPGAAT